LLQQLLLIAMSNPQQQLLTEASNGNLPEIKKLISQGTDMNHANPGVGHHTVARVCVLWSYYVVTGLYGVNVCQHER
jgi:hypothetical protein